MKLRSTCLVFTAMLLLGALAGAAQTSGGAPAFMSPAQASPDCAAAQLPSFEPDPIQQVGGPCGPCSDAPCQGMRVDQICAFSGGKYYTCESLLGQRCSGTPTVTLECTCWYGPLP